MTKIYNIVLVIVVLFLSGCSGNLTETNSIKEDILIKPVASLKMKVSNCRLMDLFHAYMIMQSMRILKPC